VANQKRKRTTAPSEPLAELEEYPPILKAEEVQTILRISRATFFRLVESRTIPGLVRIGGSWRVVRDRLKEWLVHESQPIQNNGYWIIRIARTDFQASYADEHSIHYIGSPASSLHEAAGVLLDYHQSEAGESCRQIVRFKNSNLPYRAQISRKKVSVEPLGEYPVMVVPDASGEYTIEEIPEGRLIE